jgi:hypothetical protein
MLKIRHRLLLPYPKPRTGPQIDSHPYETLALQGVRAVYELSHKPFLGGICSAQLWLPQAQIRLC